MGATAVIAEDSTDLPKPINIADAVAQAVADGLVRVVTGKRRERPISLRAGVREDIPIAVITETTLASGRPSRFVPPAKGDRRPIDERIAAAEQDEAVSVGIAQPHRKDFRGDAAEASKAGSAFARLSDPLGRFCAVHGLHEGCYAAGDEYDKILRKAKAAKGFVVPDVVAGENEGQLTEVQIQAMRDAAVLREQKISGLLRAIMPRAPRVMERLCYDKLEPSPYDEGLIRHCLAKLGVEFNFIDLGINRDKPV